MFSPRSPPRSAFAKTSDQSALDVLCEYVGPRQVLLVLDNWEHVVDAATDLADLLATSAELKVLATSRVPLRLRWEHVYEVQPLAQPSGSDTTDTQSLGRVAAIALFVQRAQAADRGFRLTADNVPAVIELRRRLDGLPLALELAGSRVRGSPLAHLLEQLRVQPSPPAGARDAPSRHQSLWAVADWSYRQLSPEEQSLFRLAGVFPGGCRVAAVAALAGVSPLEASSAGGTRHRLNRLGDRRLNRLLHQIVMTQARIYMRRPRPTWRAASRRAAPRGRHVGRSSATSSAASGGGGPDTTSPRHIAALT